MTRGDLLRYLTPPEIAARLGVKADRVVNWIRTGQLRAVDVGDKTRPRWRINPADLEAFELARSNLAKLPQSQPRRPRTPQKTAHEWY